MHLHFQLFLLPMAETSSEMVFKSGCQEAILKERKQDETAEVCKMIQEVDSK